jgi:hypothetical protein
MRLTSDLEMPLAPSSASTRRCQTSGLKSTCRCLHHHGVEELVDPPARFPTQAGKKLSWRSYGMANDKSSALAGTLLEERPVNKGEIGINKQKGGLDLIMTMLA